jgi:hypothetical protein
MLYITSKYHCSVPNTNTASLVLIALQTSAFTAVIFLVPHAMIIYDAI